MKFDLPGAVAAHIVAERTLYENRCAQKEAGEALRELTEELTLDHQDDPWWSESSAREDKQQIEKQIADLTRKEEELKNQLYSGPNGLGQFFY